MKEEIFSNVVKHCIKYVSYKKLAYVTIGIRIHVLSMKRAPLQSVQNACSGCFHLGNLVCCDIDPILDIGELF